MNIFQSWETVLIRKYATFSGRAGRAEFWWFGLLQFVCVFVGLILIEVSDVFAVVGAVAFIATIVPSIAVQTRRLHDTNRTGWWQLVGFIPMGWVVMLVFLAMEGEQSYNRFGPPPDRPASNAAPISAQWSRDPYGRFAMRYFDGFEWTHHVSDSNGRTFMDPPVFRPPGFT